jgi:hypothetical protein
MGEDGHPTIESLDEVAGGFLAGLETEMYGAVGA